jgi:hypothetical protein
MIVDLKTSDDILRYCQQVRQAPRDHIAEFVQPSFDLDYDGCEPGVQKAIDTALLFAMTGHEREVDDAPAPKDPGSMSPTAPPAQLHGGSDL